MKMPQYSREPKLTGFIFTKFQSSAKGSARKEKLAAEAITTLGPIICCLHFNWRLYFKVKKKYSEKYSETQPSFGSQSRRGEY